MTTVAAYHPQPGRSPLPLLLAALIAIALLAAIALGVHAVAKHGTEAVAIRQACDEKGPHQIWQERSHPNKFFRVCKLDDGRHGIQIVECTARGARERTAFVPRASHHPAGSLLRIIEYLSARAVPAARMSC